VAEGTATFHIRHSTFVIPYYLAYMNNDIARLYDIAGKPERTIIGLMSGTSVDGLDVALCRLKGYGNDTEIELLNFATVPYDAGFKAEIKSVFSKKEVDLEKLTLLNPWVALQHAAIINGCLLRWGIDPATVDLIASHGQTIYHAPKSLHGQAGFGNATLQIGDGDHLAMATGIITLSDFRQKNIAAGGEGAPLAVYGDYLIFGKQGEDRIMLNIGGIANFTFLPGNRQPGEVFSTDTGPGNTLMDAYIQAHFAGQYYDTDAVVAKQGLLHEGLLAALKAHPFFTQPFPKTTGPELFNLSYLAAAQQATGTEGLPATDVMATLNRFSADTIAAALLPYWERYPSATIFASGGGMHNPLLMQHLRAALPGAPFLTTDALAVNPDAKEAVLFALLANECVAGSAADTGTGSRGFIPVLMGKISLPH
jgi:anhydro-N-acetylmuramic acid kinase